MRNMKMRVIEKLCFLLTVVSLGAADVYPIYYKNEQSEISSLVEQDIQRIGRRLQAAEKSVAFKVQVNPDDRIYYMTAEIGNPPKKYYLHIDTGSDLTWLQCDAPCRSCGETPHQLYKFRPGSLVPHSDEMCAAVRAGRGHVNGDHKTQNQQCDYDITYADRATSMGVLVREIFALRLTNGRHPWPAVIGCGYDQTGSLKGRQATDGILGLGRGLTTLPSQWAEQGLTKNVIGICFAGGGEKAGFLFFGDDHVPTSSMTWVALLSGPNIKYYEVEAAQMIYGRIELVKRGDEKRLGGIIFDTGSSLTYFTQQAYDALVSAVIKSLGDQLAQDSSDPTWPLCWRGENKFSSIADATSYFRPLTFNFRNAKLEIPPEGYLIISVRMPEM